VAAGAQHGAATLLFLAHDRHSSEGHPSAGEGRPNSQAAGPFKVSAPGGNLLCWSGGPGSISTLALALRQTLPIRRREGLDPGDCSEASLANFA
jgi:hypothetical protein